MTGGEDENLKIEKASSYLLMGGVEQTENMKSIFRTLFTGCSLVTFMCLRFSLKFNVECLIL